MAKAFLDFLDFGARNLDKIPDTEFARAISENPIFAGRSIAKEADDEGIIATFLGVPIGFQFGTAAGLSGPTALAVDILTDPTTYLAGLGAATKLGQAERLAGRVVRGKAARSATKIGRLAESAAKARVLPEHAIAQRTSILERSSQLETQSIQNLLTVVEGSNTAQATKTLLDIKSIVKRGAYDELPFDGFVPGERTIRDTLNALAESPEAAVRYLNGEIARKNAFRQRLSSLANAKDYRTFKKEVKAIRKLEPSLRVKKLLSNEQLRDFRALYDEAAEAGVSPAEKVFKDVKDPETGKVTQVFDAEETFRRQFFARGDGMAGPARQVIGVEIPFTNKRMELPVGQSLTAAFVPVAERVRKFGQGLGKQRFLIEGARSAARAMSLALDGPKPLARADTLFELGEAGVRFLQNPADEELAKRFLGLHRVANGQIRSGKLIANLYENELTAIALGGNDRFIARALQPGGEASKVRLEELGKVRDILLDTDTYLDRGQLPGVGQIGNAVGPQGPGVTTPLRAGTFGQSRIYGTLTDVARKRGMTDHHVLLAESVATTLENFGQEAVRQGLIKAQLGEYLPRITKILKQAEYDEWLGSRGLSKNTISGAYSHGFERTIPLYNDLLALEKRGVLLVEKDLGKILGRYIESTIEAGAKGRFLEKVSAAPVLVPIKEGDKIDDQIFLPMIASTRNKKLIKGFEKEYVPIDGRANPGVLEFAEKMGIRGEKGQYYVHPHDTILVHKDSAGDMIKLLERTKLADAKDPISKRIWEKALVLNGAAKRSLLWFSGFHYMALFESAIADLGWQFLRNPLRAIRDGQRDFFEASDIMDLAVRSGLQFGPLLDAEVGTVAAALKQQEKSIPFLTPAARALGRLTTVWDRPLWDYYHNGLKMYAFSEIYQRGLKRFGPENAARIARETADHVNNAFGGQVWENLLVNKRGQNIARMFLMAPDWTHSNLRIALDVFANRFARSERLPQLLTGQSGFAVRAEELLQPGDVRAFFSRRYALQAGLIWGSMAALANFAFTGHFPWDNPEGHKSQIQLPWKDEDGRQLFMSPGKQFKEPFELIGVFDGKDPIDFFNRKVGRLPGTIFYTATGRDYFGRPIVHEDSEGNPIRALANKLGYAFGQNLPIPLQEVRKSVERGVSGRDILFVGLGAAGLPIRRGERPPPGTAPPEVEPQTQIPQEFGDLVQDPKFVQEQSRIRDQLLGSARLPVARSALLPVF